MADDMPIPRELCGWPLGIEGDDERLAIEIEQEDSNLLTGSSCMQDHAVEWMARPLPAGKPVTVHPRTRGDRFVDGLVLAVLVVAAALMLLGVFTVVRWLGGRD